MNVIKYCHSHLPRMWSSGFILLYFKGKNSWPATLLYRYVQAIQINSLKYTEKEVPMLLRRFGMSHEKIYLEDMLSEPKCGKSVQRPYSLN